MNVYRSLKARQKPPSSVGLTLKAMGIHDADDVASIGVKLLVS